MRAFVALDSFGSPWHLGVEKERTDSLLCLDWDLKEMQITGICIDSQVVLHTPLSNKSCFDLVIVLHLHLCLHCDTLIPGYPFWFLRRVGECVWTLQISNESNTTYYWLSQFLFPLLFVGYLLHLQAENRHANDLPSSSVYCLPFFAGIKGDRFTKYIVQSYYGVWTRFLYGRVHHAVVLDQDVGRGACLRDSRARPRACSGLWGPGTPGTEVPGPVSPHSPSFPLPGREKRVLHARRPWAAVCNSRDGLKTYSCYISCGLIESRSLKFSSLILLHSLFFLHSFSVNCCLWCFSFC